MKWKEESKSQRNVYKEVKSKEKLKSIKTEE